MTLVNCNDESCSHNHYWECQKDRFKIKKEEREITRMDSITYRHCRDYKK